EDDHQDRNQQVPASTKALDRHIDAGVDGTGLHGDAEEPANDQDEQGNVDGAVQEAGIVGANLLRCLVLDPVHAVDRRLEGVLEQPLRILIDAVVCPWNGLTVLIVVRPCWNKPGEDGHQDKQEKEDGEGGWECELALFLGLWWGWGSSR